MRANQNHITSAKVRNNFSCFPNTFRASSARRICESSGTNARNTIKAARNRCRRAGYRRARSTNSRTASKKAYTENRLKSATAKNAMTTSGASAAATARCSSSSAGKSFLNFILRFRARTNTNRAINRNL